MEWEEDEFNNLNQVTIDDEGNFSWIDDNINNNDYDYDEYHKYNDELSNIEDYDDLFNNFANLDELNLDELSNLENYDDDENNNDYFI